MVNFTVYGGVFCVSPLQILTVDTANMAAIEVSTKRGEMRNFLQFMADLQLQQPNTPIWGTMFSILLLNDKSSGFQTWQGRSK